MASTVVGFKDLFQIDGLQASWQTGRQVQVGRQASFSTDTQAGDWQAGSGIGSGSVLLT